MPVSRMSSVIFTVLFSLSPVCAFAPGLSRPSHTTAFRTSRLTSSSEDFDDMAHDGRRSFFVKASATVASIAGLANIGFPESANAFGNKIKKINSDLASYGLPIIEKVPDGYSPLLELFGKGKNRSPLLVEFVHPADWIVTLPSNDINGEDGTIQAGEYAKGDTATLFVNEDLGSVDVSTQNKAFFEKCIVKAISQRGESIYQDFKIKKVVQGDGNYLKGQKYAICDFTYTLITGAGFEVDRKGVASVTSEGNGVQLLWAASTSIRYKKTETQLRTITDSFRVYADGIDFSASRIVYADDSL